MKIAACELVVVVDIDVGDAPADAVQVSDQTLVECQQQRGAAMIEGGIREVRCAMNRQGCLPAAGRAQHDGMSVRGQV